MKKYTLIIIVLVVSLASYPQKQYKYNKSLTNNVIFKLKDEFRNNIEQKNIRNNELKKYFHTSNYSKKFPRHTKLEHNLKIQNRNLVDLSLIYKIELKDLNQLNSFIKLIYKEGIIEYAVPEHTNELVYSPNDADNATQYYLNNLRIFDAWDISKGDTVTIIGITDTGIMIDHEDLNQNIYRNINDPIDGIDNDNDGYIDNYWGWDLGDNDNNPEFDYSSSPSYPHGVWVSGCASAVADNGVGLSGIGYRTKIMPIKVSTAANTVINTGYEGIVYAADHNCDIINCSWGSTIGDEYGQDIVNYATFNRNALVIAAAGNNGIELEFYPASFDNVFNVGASNIDDNKWDNSNYAVTVDVMAPGENVAMTASNGGYRYGWGTSFASPIVAGCAAIVKSYYDTLSALQIGEVLRTTCDNIDTVSGNEPFADLMGKGRVNLYRALSDPMSPSIRYKNIAHNIVNDTMSISGDFVNYLKPTSNLNILMTTNSPYLQLINNTLNAGQINTMDTLNNNTQPLTLLVDPDIPIDENVYLKINLIDGAYSDFQMIKLKLNRSFVDIDTNNIVATIPNNGLLVYTKEREGTGFNYKDYKGICYEMGIVLATDTDKVEDCLRGRMDFQGLNKSLKFNSDTVADQIVTSSYINTDSTVFNFTINQKIYAWNKPNYNDFIFVEYQIINNVDSFIENLNFGLFADWDIINYSLNKVDYNYSNKVAYAFYTGSTPVYSGVQLLSDSIARPYAYDNVAGGEGGIDITNGFTDNEKYLSLTNQRSMAGNTGSGNDVCSQLSCGPYSIVGHDTLRIVYAIHSSENLSELIANSINAQILYDSIFPSTVGITELATDKNQFFIYPNPATNYLQIRINNEQHYANSLVIYDIYGKQIIIRKEQLVIKNKTISIDISGLEKGIYIVQIGNNSKKFVVK